MKHVGPALAPCWVILGPARAKHLNTHACGGYERERLCENLSSKFCILQVKYHRGHKRIHRGHRVYSGTHYIEM
jgi:hypothetical protein